MVMTFPCFLSSSSLTGLHPHCCDHSYILPPRVGFLFQALSKENGQHQANGSNNEPPGIPVLLCRGHNLRITQFSLEYGRKSTVPFFELRPIPSVQKVVDFVGIVLTHIVLEPALRALSQRWKHCRQFFLFCSFAIFTCCSFSHESYIHSIMNFPEPHSELSTLFCLYVWRCA